MNGPLNFSRVVQYLTIVPAAHYRLHDTTFQLRLYQLFHLRSLSRIGHAICTPIVTWCMIAALTHAHLGLPFTALVAAYGFAYGVAVGVAMLPVGAVLYVTATAFVARFGAASLGMSVAGMFVFAALQAWSHALEPIPPPLSGSNEFIGHKRWWRESTAAQKALIMVLGGSMFVLLELIASPKVLPCQVLNYLFAAGYRPALRDDAARGARELMRNWNVG